MKLSIKDYPNASFDKSSGTGHLGFYISSPGRDPFSKRILDYKSGHGIDKFISPFLELIKHTLKEMNYENAYLIPAPTSKPENDPEYRTKPAQDEEKYDSNFNMDIRNIDFCKILCTQNKNLKLADIVKRQKPKKAKESKSADWHKDSFKKLKETDKNLNEDFLFIVVDDVYTKGGTVKGVIKFLKEYYQTAKFISLTLSKTKIVS